MVKERNEFQKRIQATPCKLNVDPDSFISQNYPTNIDDYILSIVQKDYPDYNIKKDNSGLFSVQLKSSKTSMPNPIFLVSKNKSQFLTPQKKLKLISNKKYERKAEKVYRHQMHSKDDALSFIASLIQKQEDFFENNPNIQVKNTSRIKSLHSFLNKVGKYYIHNQSIMKKVSHDSSFKKLSCKKPEKKLNKPQRFTSYKNIKHFNAPFPRDIIGLKLFFCPQENIGKKDENKIETPTAIKACYDACNLIEQTIDSNDKLTLLKKKDMIKQPKKNGYKAIHLIMCYNNTFFEIQLKTEKMNIDSELDPNISHKTSYKPEEGAITSRAVQRTPTYVEYPKINGNRIPQLVDREDSFKRFHGISISSFKKNQSEISKIRNRIHQLYRQYRPIYNQISNRTNTDNVR